MRKYWLSFTYGRSMFHGNDKVEIQIENPSSFDETKFFKLVNRAISSLDLDIPEEEEEGD